MRRATAAADAVRECSGVARPRQRRYETHFKVCIPRLLPPRRSTDFPHPPHRTPLLPPPSLTPLGPPSGGGGRVVVDGPNKSAAGRCCFGTEKQQRRAGSSAHHRLLCRARKI